jgi:excisionase family DNA binding protein
MGEEMIPGPNPSTISFTKGVKELESVPEQTNSLMLRSHELMTAIEAANQLRIHPVTLQRWAREGRVPYLKLGRKVLFSASQLNRWIESNYTGSAVRAA